MSTVISIENLSKMYRLGAIGSATLREDVSRWWARMRNKPDPFLKIGTTLDSRMSGECLWALREVSYNVREGEVLGIIGRNGAGKSTLLKVLSRVTGPTEGEIRIKGRIASLLEVGTGFHPELTGRENVFLNGAILGMTKRQIRSRFDEIVAFSGVDQFIDTPVKRYSSGMHVRLAFAVAAHLEPEILVVDEVLAVGDASFQKKCIGKMSEVSSQGRTVLLVSHNMGVIQKLASAAILLRAGRVVATGDPAAVVADHLTDGVADSVVASVDVTVHPNRLSKMMTILKHLSLHGPDGQPTTDFFQHQSITLIGRYDASPTQMQLAGAGLILETSQGIRVGGFNSYMASKPPHCLPIRGQFEFRLSQPHLTPGRYTLTVSLGSHQGHLVDKVERALVFDVHPSDIYDTGYLLTPEDGVVGMVGSFTCCGEEA
jgi:lipopolysaccharide transport system ATP-binding protein